MIPRVLLALLLMCGAAFAAGINWEKDYRAAMTKAKMGNKPVMYIVSSHSCRYCVILEEETLSNPAVIEAVNQNFVAAIAYVDENEDVPQDLITGATPSIWFLLPSGEAMFEPLIGAIGPESYIKALTIVHEKFTQIQQ